MVEIADAEQEVAEEGGIAVSLLVEGDSSVFVVGFEAGHNRVGLVLVARTIGHIQAAAGVYMSVLAAAIVLWCAVGDKLAAGPGIGVGPAREDPDSDPLAASVRLVVVVIVVDTFVV